MLWKRLIAGPVMAAVALGVLWADAEFAPRYPILFALVLLSLSVGIFEFARLVPLPYRPRRGVLALGVYGTALMPFAEAWCGFASVSFSAVLFAFTVATLLAILVELYHYDTDGTSTLRLAATVLGFAYLGVFTTFFLKLRWLSGQVSGLMLAAAIFVPKCGDIGAYFVGRFLGKTPFSPKISPKKTWEGFGGAVLGAVLAALLLHAVGPVFRFGWLEAVAFGLLFSVIGILGDLAESMLKRDGLLKDASARIPGFGGVLDVVDAVLFSAPLVYAWFVLSQIL